MDLFVLGEGEDVSVELIQLYRKAREEGWDKEEFLTAAARVPASMCPPSMTCPTTTTAPWPPSATGGAPAVVTKRIVQDFDKSYFPVKTIVPPPRSSTTG